MTLDEFDCRMVERGWIVLESKVPQELVTRMIQDLEAAYIRCRNIQTQNGIAANNESTVHHLIGQGESFLDYLKGDYVDAYLSHYFHGNYILNSFGAALNVQDVNNYAHNIHRDVRTYSEKFPLIINTLVMLDDFTADNGATWLLSGSHHLPDKPSEDYFYEYAEQVIAPAGSILIFDSNVWHAAGRSTTTVKRRSVTPMYSRPFVKPQFDYPRALGYDNGGSFPERVRQVLGYNSRIPATLDEWYQPPHNRMYRPDQG